MTIRHSEARPCCIIGIDPSMNSTGICINKNGKYTFKLLATKPTKKFRAALENTQGIDLYIVEKEPTIEGQDTTTKNINHILTYIKTILAAYKPDYVMIEAPAFSASGRTSDLSGLNYAIRLECLNRDIPCHPIFPTSVKKGAIGNGRATKDMIVQTWLKLFPQYSHLQAHKIDDLADAYFICEYDDYYIKKKITL